MDRFKQASKMASYVLFKDLYDNGKRDIYFVLSKFIEDIIFEKQLYCFSLPMMVGDLKNTYGFSIPDFVVQTSIKKLDYIVKKNSEYYVDRSLLPNENVTIKNKLKEEDGINSLILKELIIFCEIKIGKLNDEERARVLEDFYLFLLDSNGTNKYSEVISTFIVNKSEDQKIYNQLMEIKQGAVLYAGLNYNSTILPRSKWKNELSIFLETEILFHLAGYNGVLFQELAEEMLKLITEINSRSERIIIHLKYFDDVNLEVDNFFKKAEELVQTGGMLTSPNSAMTAIVTGSNSPSDVLEKRGKFANLLLSKNIQSFEKNDYYAEENFAYNLESKDLFENYEIEEDKEKYLKHLSYINILRKGKQDGDLSKSKYLVLTETGKILQISKDLSKDQDTVPLAINMYLLTNRLWYDLNKGFGSLDFPKNFDILTKAKILLSKSLSVAFTSKFELTKAMFEKNEINDEQLTYTILELRDQVKKPEDIDNIIIDEVWNNISEDDILKYANEKQNLKKDIETKRSKLMLYEEVLENNKTEIIEKDDKIKSLDEKNRKLLFDRKNYLLEVKQKTLDSKLNVERKVSSFRKKLKITCFTIMCFYYGVVFYLSLENNNKLCLFVFGTLPIIVLIFLKIAFNKDLSYYDCYISFFEHFEKRYLIKLKKVYKFDENELQKIENDISKVEDDMNDD